VAEQVTVVEPTGKVEPDDGLQLGVRAPSRSSVAEAEKVTVVPLGELVLAVTGELGTETAGGVESDTVTVKEPFPTLLWLSVALQFTVVAPNPNVEPDVGEQFTVTDPSTMSEADAE
jgi:hypothetical protein